MAGHSKWSNIKRKKAAVDAKRSKMFSAAIKEIHVAAKEGGNDPEANPRLRMAIANAKGINVPKDNIKRAIAKAGDKNSANFQEVTYEGYAPYGGGVFVECLTDNIQRTVAAVRSYFNKYNGKLDTHGSLNFIFDRKGVFTIPKKNLNLDEEDFLMEVIDAGAEEVETEGSDYETIYTAMEDFGSMQKKLEEIGLEVESQELQRIPKTTVKLDKEQAKQVLKLIEALEDDEDVQKVFHNLELTEEIMEEI